MTKPTYHEKKAQAEADLNARELAKRARNVSLIALGVSIVGVFVSGGVSLYSAYEANRAMVSVIGAVPAGPQPDHPFHYALQYVNTGKETAQDVVFNQVHSLVDAPPQADDFSTMVIPENKTCEMTEPKPGAVAYPSFGGNAVLQQGMDTGKDPEPILYNGSLMRGEKFIIAQGCVAYRTFFGTHKSGWCLVFQTRLVPMPMTEEERIASPGRSNYQFTINPLRCPKGFSTT